MAETENFKLSNLDFEFNSYPHGSLRSIPVGTLSQAFLNLTQLTINNLSENQIKSLFQAIVDYCDFKLKRLNISSHLVPDIMDSELGKACSHKISVKKLWKFLSESDLNK